MDLLTKIVNLLSAVQKSSNITSSQVHVPTAGSEKKLKKDFPTEGVQPAAAKPDLEPQDPNDPPDAESAANMYPGMNNLEAEMVEMAFTPNESDPVGEGDEGVEGDAGNSQLHALQELVSGIDWEMSDQQLDSQSAQALASENLTNDPDYYKKLRSEGTDDELQKSAGLKLDLGSGSAREDGYLGFDTYPYDHGTLVHDLSLGIPVPDGSASNVRMVNALEHMDELREDPTDLINEINRVLIDGGTFSYEGPFDLVQTDLPPGLVLLDHSDNMEGNEVQKQAAPIFKQTFTKFAVPDPATANGAEPRPGLDALSNTPDDAEIATEGLNYYWSDESTSRAGNILHGYPSQGALTKGGPGSGPSAGSGKGGAPAKPGHGDHPKGGHNPKGGHGPKEHGGHEAHGQHGHGFNLGHAAEQLGETAEKKSYFKKSAADAQALTDGQSVVLKMDTAQQIVYGVVLAPDEIDSQEDWMSAEDIEEAAHQYLIDSRVIGSDHTVGVYAIPVESYIAPMDLSLDGQYGPQMVKKGSWVLAVKIMDPAEWDKVVAGEYTGFSVGGKGHREPASPSAQVN